MKIYPEEEMLVIFKDLLDIDISKSEMAKYNPELVQQIYTIFCRDFGSAIKRFNILSIDAPQNMQQYPDMYRNAVFPLQLGHCIKSYLKLTFDCNDFKIIDIFQPDPVRTRRFFSMLIEFYCHIKKVITHYDEMEKEVDLEREFHETLIEDIKFIEREIKKREIENAEKEICLEKSQKVIEAAKETLETSQERKNRLKGRLEGLKISIQELVYKIKENELAILEATEKVNTLQAHVVHESEFEKIKNDEENLASFKASIDQLRESMKLLQHDFQLIKKSELFHRESLLSALEEYRVIDTKKMEIFALNNEKDKEKAKLHEKAEELLRSEPMLKEHIALLEENCAQAQKSSELKKKGVEDEIRRLKQTFDEQQRKKEEIEIVEGDLNADYKNILQQIDAFKLEYNQISKVYSHYSKELKTKVEKNLQKDLDNIGNKLKQDLQRMYCQVGIPSHFD